MRLEGFIQNVTEYVENRIAITKLEAKQKIADVGSTIAAMIPAALFGLFGLIFLSLTLAQALNVWLDSRVWGFLIVAAIYLIAAYVMFTQRDAVWLKKKIVDGSTKFLKDTPKEDKKDAGEEEEIYQPAAVEHRKVIFEEPVAADRPPQPSGAAVITTEDDAAVVVPTKGNATIVVSENEKDAKERAL